MINPMRITWMAVCERFVILANGCPQAHNIYLGEIPLKLPNAPLPLSVLFVAQRERDDRKLHRIQIRILNSEGAVIDTMDGKFPPPEEPGFEGPSYGGAEGFIRIPTAGKYQVEIQAEGQALDDTPNWELIIVPRP